MPWLTVKRESIGESEIESLEIERVRDRESRSEIERVDWREGKKERLEKEKRRKERRKKRKEKRREGKKEGKREKGERVNLDWPSGGVVRGTGGGKSGGPTAEGKKGEDLGASVV